MSMSKTRIVALIGALLLCATSAHAQVNTERFRKQMNEDGLRGSAELYFANRTGNSDLLSGGASLNLGWRGGVNGIIFTGRADVGTTHSTTTINRGFVHLRGNRELSERLTWELFTQREYDRFARLDARTLLGSGPRVPLYRGEAGTIHVGIAYMAEWEQIDVAPGSGEDSSQFYHRVSGHLAASLKAGDRLTLSNTVYLQPRWRERSDTRLLNEFSARIGMGGALSLKIALVIRRDGDPPSGVKKVDSHLSNRLVWDF